MGKEERRLDDEQTQMSPVVSPEEEDADAPLPPPRFGVEGLCLTSYASTRERVLSRMDVKEAQSQALGSTVATAARGGLPGEGKKVGQFRSADRSLTQIESMAIQAEQRYGEEERRLHQLLHDTSVQARAEENYTKPLIAVISPSRPQSAPTQRVERVVERKEVQEGESEGSKGLMIKVEEEDEHPPQERPIALSPPSTLPSPLQLLHHQQLVFPSRPSPSPSPTHSHTARASTPPLTHKRESHHSTPLSARTAPRPSTADLPSSALRRLLLQRQRRTDGVTEQSVKSLMGVAENKGMGWQVRLSMLEEADGREEEREEKKRRRQKMGEVMEDKEAIMEVLAGAERLRRTKVSMGSLGVVCEPAGPGVVRQQPIRPHSSASMRRYVDKMAGHMDGAHGVPSWR